MNTTLCLDPIAESESGALHDRLSHVLRRHPHLRRQRLYCEAAEGRVVLRGNVGTYFQKQMAQEALRGLDGVGEIDNQLEVCWAPGDVY